MKLKEKKYSLHLDITKSLIDYDGVKLKKVMITITTTIKHTH